MHILAFDVGSKRTGVAVGQPHTQTCEPAGLLQVSNGRFDWPKIDNLVDRWQPALCVVGRPQSGDQALLKIINRLQHYLRSQHKLDIEEVLESYSTEQANEMLAHREIETKKRPALRDQLAAMVILQQYFNHQSIQKN